MAYQLEAAILKLRAALRAAAWDDHEQARALVCEARVACDEWLGQSDLALTIDRAAE
jgi:hypothetical protein